MFTIKIDATREKVWLNLWQDESLRDWSGIVDPGTHMIGELEQGKTVQFNSTNGYGVTSLVDRLIPNKYVLFKHKGDTQDNGNRDREAQ